jgi:hypothetical protein
MNLPTAKEIDPYDSLDGRAACKNFLGKSLDEAEALFRENSLHYQEDLMWMGPVAFRYYIQAAISYIQSEAATNDSAIASCIAMILEFRLEHESADLVPIADQLAFICRYIIEHYERFDLTPEIYGDVRARIQALQQTFLNLSSHDRAARPPMD